MHLSQYISGGLVFACQLAAAAKQPAKYNTRGTRKEGVTNVHIIPHSHDDVGWLKTVDQYFYGANNTIQHANVNSILTAMIAQLLENPDRKFIFVEQAFFQRWWDEQSKDKKDQVKDLVKSGQLEFINGGWCMHDEASPTFVDMVDQTTLGHRFLMDEFDVAPQATWQIDPFGHSGFQASMMSSPLSGFNSVFFARADYQDQNYRKTKKSTEFYWQTSPSQGDTTATLGGILADYYYPPAHLNFGGDDATPPVMDDGRMEDYNVDERVETFVQTALSFQNFTAGNDVMFMMGTDFSYENAVTWFKNIDKIIHYVNLDGRVNALYSTPSIYARAKIASVKLPVRTDDMFPYADDAHAVWAGYFTSRPALKGYIRSTSSFHQTSRQLQLLSGLEPSDLGPSNPLYLLERAISVAQHHDAVSGTSKQHVADDYAKRLSIGRSKADAMVSQAFGALTGDNSTFAACDLANATICPLLQDSSQAIVTLLVHNPLSTSRTNLTVRLPALMGQTKSFRVIDSSGNAIVAQVYPVGPADAWLAKYYAKQQPKSGPSDVWLAFQASVPAMGFSTYFIQRTASLASAPLTHMSRPLLVSHGEATTLTNGIVSISTDAVTGLVSSFSKPGLLARTVPLSQNFYWYNSSKGGPDDKTGDWQQKSGAYIFRPNSSTTFPVMSKTSVELSMIQGPVINELRQTFSEWAYQSIRLAAGEEAAEFEYTVGPIPFHDDLGKEIISKYSTDIPSASTWFSDSNGRDSMRRTRNARPSLPSYDVREPVADNYVPVNLFQYLAGDNVTLAVVTDRTHGGSSLQDGELEFMVHRRLQFDDNRGVGEPLNETFLSSGLANNGLVVRGTHKLTIDATAVSGRARRRQVAQSLFRPHIVLAPAQKPPRQWRDEHTAQASLLSHSLDERLHVLTTHWQSHGKVLVRVAHMYETGEDSILSQPLTVDLASLFSNFRIVSATEMSLTANKPLAQLPKTTYQTADGRSVSLPVINPAPAGADLSIQLKPMQIRTFLCEVA